MLILFLFKSTHRVVKAEKLSRKSDLECKIVPVPRSISSECGMAIEIEEKHSTELKELLRASNVEFTVCNEYRK